MNYVDLKALIDAKVYENTGQEITGANLNSVLNAIATALQSGYLFGGVVSPTDSFTTGDENVLFLAYEEGTYSSFGSAVLDGTSLHLLSYSTSWNDIDLNVPTKTFLDDYAKIDGYYQSLIAGAAENLIDPDGSETNREFTFDTSGGSADIGTGKATLAEIKGRSLAFNQLVDSGTTQVTITSGHKYLSRINGTDTLATSDGTAISVTGGTDNVHDLTLMGIADSISSVADFTKFFPLPYYAYDAGSMLNFTATALKTTGRNLYNHTAGTARLPQVSSSTGFKIQGTYTSLSFLADGASASETITPDANGQFTTDGAGVLTITGGNSTDTMVYVYWSGEDKAFEAYESHTYDLSWLYSLTDGNNNTPFSDGMKSAGSAADWVDPAGGEGQQVVGFVDLGDLTWTYSPSTLRFSATLATMNSVASWNGAGIVCSKYKVGAVSSDGTTDKLIGAYSSSIFVSDSSYTDADTFKAAMSGVKLYYELATPVDLTFTAVGATYDVNDWGTEEITPANTSDPATAPSNFQVVYNINAIDTLTNLPRNYVSINSDNADDSTLKALASALNTALGISISWTWSEENREYTFSVSDGRAFKMVEVPASASATGTAGNIAIDTDYLYVCVATDTWKRVAISTWA